MASLPRVQTWMTRRTRSSALRDSMITVVHTDKYGYSYEDLYGRLIDFFSKAAGVPVQE